jgi:hypothetical protein
MAPSRRPALAVFYFEVRMATINVEVKMAWWLTAYVYCLAAFVALTACEPNWHRVNYWVSRGIMVRVAGSSNRWHRVHQREGIGGA